MGYVIKICGAIELFFQVPVIQRKSEAFDVEWGHGKSVMIVLKSFFKTTYLLMKINATEPLFNEIKANIKTEATSELKAQARLYLS